MPNYEDLEFVNKMYTKIADIQKIQTNNNNKFDYLNYNNDILQTTTKPMHHKTKKHINKQSKFTIYTFIIIFSLFYILNTPYIVNLFGYNYSVLIRAFIFSILFNVINLFL